MSAFETIILPAVVLLLALGLARREWRLYRLSNEIGSDLFVYSRWRLVRRLGGVIVLVGLAATFAALGAWPPHDARAANTYLGLIVGEIAVLVVFSVLDLLETSRTARPGVTGSGPLRPTRTDKPRRRLR